MSDNPKDQNNSGTAMADLLDAYEKDKKPRVHVGDKIKGEIIAIGKDTVFVDTGTKIDGVVDIEELLDAERNLNYKVGDTLELYVMSIRSSGITLSRAISGVGGDYILEEAFEKAVPIEGKVKAQVKGGFEIELVKRRAFCPISQIDLKYVNNPEDYVGHSFEFIITKFEEGGKNVVVSRRVLLEQEQQKIREAFFRDLVVGAVVDGLVTKLMPFGAFVELTPGVEGMVPISEMGWSRTEKVEDILAVGQTIKAKIIVVSGEKITLSLKQVSADPWDTVLERYKPGDKLRGKVMRLSNFGAFVELEPGIEGLVHISEMSYRKRVNKPEEVVNPGDFVAVLVKDIDTAKKRISLSIKDAEGDPWVDIGSRYPVGKVMEGSLEKKEKFGWFIVLEPGITGLLPKSRIDKAPDPGEIDKIKPGMCVKIKIEEINADERKITLGLAETGEEDWQRFSSSTSVMNPLAAKLQKAMTQKKKPS
ncbi:MAG TPA: S1 RNA-binding domain-containing protein [Deltaproteobacteria bacterium]|nr:S1 RNA-binding domain-containing protein [Deltaproteobacteria bacterium]